MPENDHLTRLLTRAAFDAAISACCASATTDAPTALVMADVDHFKKINDTHGHPVGDQVLSDVARKIESVVRGKGTAYRYGGEEFALLLPNHSCEEAVAVAERLRAAVESALLGGLRATSSFGVAVVPTHATEPIALLEKADAALYDAKQKGRNLVRFSGEPDPQPDVARTAGPPRKLPVPGQISDAERERLRRSIIKHGGAYCPTCPDDMPLKAHDVTSYGEFGQSFVVVCPACGFTADLISPT